MSSGGNLLGGAGEEGVGEVRGGVGGYGLALYGSAEGCAHSLEDGLFLVYSHRTTQAMSEEQLRAFMEAVKADAGLQEQLKAAGDADAVVAIAKAAGFLISSEELKRAQAEVSEEELETVSGGTGANSWITCIPAYC